MYRAIRLFAGTALVALVACSNDTEMPSQYHRGLLAQPTDVQAGVEGGVVSMSWQMATAENVVGFVVSFTDASGGMETKAVADLDARVFVDDGSLSTESGTVWQIRVWAVDARDFFGPQSEPFILEVP